MNLWLQHLPILPIVVPLTAGAALLLLPESHRAARLTLAVISMLVQFAAAAGLLYLTSDATSQAWPADTAVYRIGGWPPPFGIVLVVDRLAAIMVALSATIALSVLVYSIARWDRPGQPFHALLQFLAMGLNGAFLTGDLFNLFVFFEVLLAASYGLVLRGAGTVRVRAGLHYIAVNLAASLLFLTGVALIYGVTGTLNMADLTVHAGLLSGPARILFDTGAAILGVAFLVKAASWPLNFWLPDTYSAAIEPVAAVFVLLTKVGIYALLRLGTLLSLNEAAASTLQTALFGIGLATLAAGMNGMLGAQRLVRLISHSVIVSTGILLAAFGLGIEALTAPALFYLITSALASGIFFMLAGMTARMRPHDTQHARPVAMPSPPYVAYGIREPDAYDTGDEVGVAIPAPMAFLGLVFVCCVLLVTGLPPLPGFLAKFMLLSEALNAAPGAISTWLLIASVIAAGLAGLVALTRMGSGIFWAVTERATPRLRLLEAAPVAALVIFCFALAAHPGPVMNYLESAARSLHEPQTYIRAILPEKTDSDRPETPAP